MKNRSKNSLKTMRKLSILILAAILLLCGCGKDASNGENAAGEAAESEVQEDVGAVSTGEFLESIAPGDDVIIYTNDIHCETRGELNYDTVKQLKDGIAEKGNYVFLADCGDFLTSKDESHILEDETVIDLMNDAGYDAAALGNHEFDGGCDHLYELSERAKFPFVSCNFLDADGDPAYDPYIVSDTGKRTIAFIGITTPETIRKARGRDFTDGNGEVIWSFCEEDDDTLNVRVQECIDEVKGEADMVIALSHLGVGESVWPYRSIDVIENTEGIDAVLDGHSHTVIKEEHYQDKAGNDVILTQTGAEFAYIGCLVIGEDGSMRTVFIK